MDSTGHHLAVYDVEIIRLKRESTTQESAIQPIMIQCCLLLPSVEVIDLDIDVVRRILWNNMWTDVYTENLRASLLA